MTRCQQILEDLLASLRPSMIAGQCIAPETIIVKAPDWERILNAVADATEQLDRAKLFGEAAR